MALEKSMNISYGVEAKYKFPTWDSKVEFDPITKCSFIDILHHEGVSGTKSVLREGLLDDDSLHSWLDQVSCDSPCSIKCLYVETGFEPSHVGRTWCARGNACAQV